MEHKVVSVGPDEQLEAVLNEYADEGWGLVQVIVHDDAAIVIFERSKAVYK